MYADISETIQIHQHWIFGLGISHDHSLTFGKIHYILLHHHDQLIYFIPKCSIFWFHAKFETCHATMEKCADSSNKFTFKNSSFLSAIAKKLQLLLNFFLTIHIKLDQAFTFLTYNMCDIFPLTCLYTKMTFTPRHKLIIDVVLHRWFNVEFSHKSCSIFSTFHSLYLLQFSMIVNTICFLSAAGLLNSILNGWFIAHQLRGWPWFSVHPTE